MTGESERIGTDATDDAADITEGEPRTGAAEQDSRTNGSWSRVKEFFRSRHWTRAQKITAAVVAAIGLVTGVISIVPILFADATSFASIEITVKDPDRAVAEYAAASEELPEFVAFARSCGPDERAWLDAHAIPLARTILVAVGNTAADGPMASLTDFRVAGTVGSTGDAVRVVCQSGPASAARVQAARIDTGDPHAEAVFDLASGSVGDLPGIAVARNLAPGETEQLLFEVFGSNDFEGRLTAVATVRGEPRVVEIERSEIRIPGLRAAGMTFVLVGPDGVSCRRSGVDDPSCDLTRFLDGSR